MRVVIAAQPARARHRRVAIGHKRGLDRLHNFDQGWQLHCEAFAKVSDRVAQLLGRAAEEGKVVVITARP